MSTTQNRALIAAYFAVVAGRDTSTPLADFFAKDVIWHVPRSNPDIVPNPRVGHAAVMDLLGAGIGIYQDGSLNIQRQCLLADGDCVMAQFTLDAKLADGRDYSNEYIMLFRIDNGRINRVWEYLDTLHQWQLGTFDDRV